MQQFLEIIPVVLFFFAYYNKGNSLELFGYTIEFDGIYTATAILMIATLIHLILTWAITKKVEKRLLLLALVIIVTGGLTLFLQNNKFIQWKPTLFNWVLALAFIIAPFFGGKKTLMERMLGSQLTLPGLAWLKLNKLWIANFIIVGALNLVVAYGFSESAWVSYKLYSSIIFTLLVTLFSAIILMPYLKADKINQRHTDDD